MRIRQNMAWAKKLVCCPHQAALIQHSDIVCKVRKPGLWTLSVPSGMRMGCLLVVCEDRRWAQLWGLPKPQQLREPLCV